VCVRKTGKKWEDKLDATRDKIKNMGCDAMVVTALDEIAWLLNIRGYDIPYGPFLKSYAIVSKDQLHLYTNQHKLSSDVRRHLRAENCFSAHCARSDQTQLTLGIVVVAEYVKPRTRLNFRVCIYVKKKKRRWDNQTSPFLVKIGFWLNHMEKKALSMTRSDNYVYYKEL